MSEIDLLLQSYNHVVQLPWANTLSSAEKVWFVVYSPNQERRLRLRLTDFRTATKNADHVWYQIDLSETFSQWMANHKYREAYFEAPDLLESALSGYAQSVAQQIGDQLNTPTADDNTVVALTGLSSLFGLASVSEIVNIVRNSIQGRLLVFFPGYKEGSNYRFLDAKDGWNYLSIAVTATDGNES